MYLELRDSNLLHKYSLIQSLEDLYIISFPSILSNQKNENFKISIEL